MPKFCEHCGTPLQEGARFCTGCGHPVAQPSQPRQQQNTNTQGTYNPNTGSPNTGDQNTSNRQAYDQQRPDADLPSSKPEPKAGTESPKKKGGCGKKLLLIVLIVVSIAGAGSYIQYRIEQKRFNEEMRGKIASTPVQTSTPAQPQQNHEGSGSSAGTPMYIGKGFSEKIVADAQNGGVTLGGIKSADCKLFVENGTFADGAVVEARPAPKEFTDMIQRSDKFDMLITPMDISCDQYDGTFFGTDVILTMLMPRRINDGEEADLNKYVFICYDENTKQMRYLWPTGYDIEKNTMSVRMPHFSFWATGKLSEKEEIEQYLNNYCMNLAVQRSQKKQAASELEPYVKAKVAALGLTKEAAKDLVQATVNVMVSQATSTYAANEDGTEYDWQESFGYSNGVKAATSAIRGVWDQDPSSIENGMKDFLNSSVMEAWNNLKFSERTVDALFSSATIKEFAPGGITTGLSNASGIGAVLGRCRERDWDGALQEMGNIMQGIHPAVELGTKGAKFLAEAANTAFTNWKANEVEELYQIYKNGGKFLFGNEVIAGNRESFIDYLNYSSGFMKAKGVYRFYNMDKVAEVCERFGWSRSDYDNLDSHYRAIFEQRVEDGLMQYFEQRRKQEAEAEKIKEVERVCINEMLNPYTGVLNRGNYASFFGEQSYKDFDISKRLQRLAHIRAFVSQYVNEEELAKTAKLEDSYNYGYLINTWVDFASRYPRAKAIEKFCEHLKGIGLLKEGSAPEPQEKDELDLLIEFLNNFNCRAQLSAEPYALKGSEKLKEYELIGYEFVQNGDDVHGYVEFVLPEVQHQRYGNYIISIKNKDEIRTGALYNDVAMVLKRGGIEHTEDKKPGERP